MGVSDGTDVPDSSLDQTSVYVVRKGDNLSTIATLFGVSVDTILWANDMKKGDKLVEVFSTHPNIIKRLKALQELSINQAINT